MFFIWPFSDQKRYFKPLKYLFLCLCCSFLVYSPASLADCPVSRVDEWTGIKKIIDGDTVITRDGRKVRFIGINTPETGREGQASEPFGMQARQELERLLEHETEVGLTYGKQKKDKYKRLLAHPSLRDGRNVAAVLLKQGLGVSIVVPPNDQYLACYRRVEQQARNKQRGLWQLPENKVLSAGRLSSRARGYRFVRGSIRQYNTSKKSIYLEFNKKLAIRIAKRDLKYFRQINLKNLEGSKVIVRGWVNSYKGRQSIYLSHAEDIKIVKK